MPLTPLLPGDPTRLGPHRLLGRLGQGGMGTVYLGMDAGERAVAVKVLREGPADLEGRRRFARELEALQRVRGEHVVQVLGGDVAADTPWIVTRFVPGRRLDEHVCDQGPLDEAELRQLADGLAEALHVLGRCGLVHRDLTPGNVLLVDGEPQVIDLGLAVMSDVATLTSSGLLLGTAGYLAPEQVLGDPVTAAADVHAWGAVVAYAATGRPPFGTGRPDLVLYRVVHGEPDLAGVPASLLGLVRDALAKEPRDRPRPAELGQALAALPVAAPAPAADPIDLTELLGPRATQVLGDDVTRVLGGLEHTRVLSGAGGTRVPAALLPAPRQQAGAPDRGDLDQRPGAEITTEGGEAPPNDEPQAEPKRSRTQAWVLALAALALLGALAQEAPAATAISVALGAALLQVAARSRQARLRRVERRGPRAGEALVSLLAIPWHVARAALDLLVLVPLAAGAALGAGLLAIESQARRDEVSDARAVAVALVVGVVVLLVQGRARGSRVLLRRAATAASPTAAVLFVLAFAVLAVALVAHVDQVGSTWSPLSGSPFR